MSQQASVTQIYKLIEDALSDDDLRNLCHSDFPKVYNQFTTGQTKSQRIRLLIEYAQRQLEIPKLLQAIELINPNGYREFANAIQQEPPEDRSCPDREISPQSRSSDPIVWRSGQGSTATNISQPRKSNRPKSVINVKQSQEIARLVATIKNSRSNVGDIEKALKRLRRIALAKQNQTVIKSILTLLSSPNKSLTISIVAVGTLERVAQEDLNAIRKVAGLWKDSIDKKFKLAIVQCLGSISDRNQIGISKLISILGGEKDSVLIQRTADNLAKIAVGDRSAIDAMERKLRFAPATPKIIRRNLAKNLNIIDPGNSLAAKYKG
jgi:hypothetical protein